VSNGRQQVRHGLMYFVPVVVGNLAPIVTLPIFTRVLTPGDYGAWALATAYATLVTSIANVGLTSLFERDYFEQTDARGRSTLLHSLVAFVVAALLLGGVVTWWSRDAIARMLIGDGTLGGLVLWMYCAVAISSVKAYYLIALKNAQNASAYIFYSIDETILNIVASMALIVWLGVGVIGLALGQLLASGTVTALLVIRFARAETPAFSSAMLASGLRTGLPLMPRLIVNVAGNQLDKYLIGLVSTVSLVGLFTIGQRIANFAFAYMTALENVFVPQVYRRMFALGDDGAAEIGHYLTPFAYVSAVISLLIALFAEEALVVLTAPQFHDAASVASLLSVGYGLMFFRKQPQLLYRKATWTISVFSMTTVALNVIVSVPMILAWGGLGAAGGALVAAILAGGIHYVISQRAYRIDYELGRMAAVFGLLIVAGLTMVLLRETGVSYPIRVSAKVGFVLVYLWLGVSIGVLSRENLLTAKTALMPLRITNA
jgi:O-antigen/teichoic acid export membrane protein